MPNSARSCATPEVLVDALLDRAQELEDVRIIHLLTLGTAAYVRPEYRATSGANVRESIAAERADYTPVFLSEIEQLFQNQQLPIDVTLGDVLGRRNPVDGSRRHQWSKKRRCTEVST